MKSYEIRGRPMGNAQFATLRVGSIVELDLDAGEENDLIALGAIRPASKKDKTVTDDVKTPSVTKD